MTNINAWGEGVLDLPVGPHVSANAGEGTVRMARVRGGRRSTRQQQRKDRHKCDVASDMVGMQNRQAQQNDDTRSDC